MGKAHTDLRLISITTRVTNSALVTQSGGMVSPSRSCHLTLILDKRVCLYLDVAGLSLSGRTNTLISLSSLSTYIFCAVSSDCTISRFVLCLLVALFCCKYNLILYYTIYYIDFSSFTYCLRLYVYSVRHLPPSYITIL